MTEILPGIFQVILTDNTVEQGVSNISIYIIPGKEGVHEGRSLMIDTGFKTESCLKQLKDALAALSIDIRKLDIFLTHRHHDHCGLAGIFAGMGAVLYMNPEEERHPYDCLAYRLSEKSLDAQKKVLLSVGVSPVCTPEIWKTFMEVSESARKDGDWMLAIVGFPYRAVKAGDEFFYGEYHFKAFALKGHTYGQMGLEEKDRKIFFSADQLIAGITPIVATTYADEGLLQGFFDSLTILKNSCADWTVIPSHGSIVGNVPAETDRIVYSYLDKATKVRDFLKTAGKPVTVREVSESIYRIRKTPDNESSFFLYKMMMTKTFSLLEYLRDIGFAERTLTEGVYYWTKETDRTDDK